MTHLVKFEMKHLDEIVARNADVTHKPYLRKLCEVYAENRGAYTLLSDDGIICIAGIVPVRPGVGEAWSVTSDLIRKYAKSYYKMTKRMIGAIESDWKLHRIQLAVEADNEVAANWARHLGFQFEGLMRCAGENKKDLCLYARVNI